MNYFAERYNYWLQWQLFLEFKSRRYLSIETMGLNEISVLQFLGTNKNNRYYRKHNKLMRGFY
jgi:hypothetical protein